MSSFERFEYRSLNSPKSSPSKPRKPDQRGVIRIILVLGLLIVLVLVFKTVSSHALSSKSSIDSGIKGYCLDVYHDQQTSGTAVDSWGCNGSGAQQWSVSGANLKHDELCLSVAADGTTAGNKVVLNSCSADPGEVWLRDKSGYENPNSGLCLAAPNGVTGVQLTLANCSGLDEPSEIWLPGKAPNSASDDTGGNCNIGPEGQRVACYAGQEWTAWQSGTPSHEALLTNYTDGAPYEEWCADFVSYVYREAGYPFSNGNSNGWDENIASQIQNMGFTLHNAGNYTPQPGDIAFFDYPGGHVEIVISGGAHPTFIYGDSATIDPTTGNGDMEANTITSEPNLGQITYYLSPTSGS